MSRRANIAAADGRLAVEIRVRGRVQGVGFRPTVWRYARDLDLSGEVLNDSSGVLIRVFGSASAVEALIARIRRDPPPLARIDAIDTQPYFGELAAAFTIAGSLG
ncbi:acylphosphatase, partial [Pasteurella multocida]|nr:acylphosphatase [Pasteurella multocida]